MRKKWVDSYPEWNWDKDNRGRICALTEFTLTEKEHSVIEFVVVSLILLALSLQLLFTFRHLAPKSKANAIQIQLRRRIKISVVLLLKNILPVFLRFQLSWRSLHCETSDEMMKENNHVTKLMSERHKKSKEIKLYRSEEYSSLLFRREISEFSIRESK